MPRGQCALSSSATWQRLPSCYKEVSLLICVNEVTTLQGQATTRAHNLHSSADIYYTLLYVCKQLETNILVHPCFFNQSDPLPSYCICREGEEVSTHNTQSLYTQFAIEQMVMAFKQRPHALRKASDQREKEALFSCVSFHPIFFKADTVLFFMEWPLWNTE